MSDSVDSDSGDSDYRAGTSADFDDPVSARRHCTLYQDFVDGLGVGRRRVRDPCRGHGAAIGCIHCWVGELIFGLSFGLSWYVNVMYILCFFC